MGKTRDLAAQPWRYFAESTWGKVTIVTVGAAVLAGLIALSVLMVPAIVLGIVLWTVALFKGLDPAKLRNWAAGIGGVYLAATIAWSGSLTAPLRAYTAGIALIWDGQVAAGLIETSALWIPVGLALGTLMWAAYRVRMSTGRAPTLAWGERHQQKQKERRMARLRVEAATFPAPLTTPAGTEVIVGPAAENKEKGVPRGLAGQLGARHPQWVTVPLEAIQQHIAVVGDPGSGKTTLLRRLGLGAAEAMWQAHRKGAGDRPLVLFIDCKGAPTAADEAVGWIDQMIRIGVPASRTATWPFTTRLNIWSMAPRDLTSCLQQMVRASHEHYDELREALLHLVIDAEGGAPKSGVEFLSRLDPDWLKAAWAAYPNERGQVDAVCAGKEPIYMDARLKYANLFRSLGQALDAGNDLNDYDAIYFGIAGTRRPKEAQAQAAAVLQLVNDLLHRHHRQVLIVLDEYSAVSGGTGIGAVDAVERWRSLGASVIVGAQSWHGLGETDDERGRLVAACSGGRLMLRSTDAERLSMVSGTVKRAEASQHITGHQSGDQGSYRVQDGFAVPPQRIREMEPGDIAYAVTGGVTWGRVALLPELRVAATAPVDTTPMLPPAVPLAELTAGINAYLVRRDERGNFEHKPGKEEGQDQEHQAPKQRRAKATSGTKADEPYDWDWLDEELRGHDGNGWGVEQ